MRSEKEVRDRIDTFKANMSLAEESTVTEGAVRYIRNALTELNWVLE